MKSEAADIEFERVRQMADRLECVLEEDVCILAGATPNTVEAWRKRGSGPASVRFGNRYFYPIKGLSEHLNSLIKSRPGSLSGSSV